MFPIGFKYFNLIDLASVAVWAIIILLIAYNRNTKNAEKPHYKWYLRNVYANLTMGILFGILYINFLGGGDTEAYYMGSTVLSNLFIESPSDFFQFIGMEYSHDYTSAFFNLRTGYPPGWIFREEQGFFVSKLLVPLCIICFKSYWGMTLVLSFLSAQASWKLFEFARSYHVNNETLLAFGVLLLPSVNFWCSGVAKDTIVYIATIYLVFNAFQIMSAERQASFKNYVYALVAAFFIYHIRSFILAAILIPMLFSLSARVVKSLGGGDNAVIFARTFALLIGLGIGGRTLINSNLIAESSALQQAAIIQDDFAHNELYGDKKYDIGTIEFTLTGLIKITPFAILAGIYKPLIWEARSLTLIMNGLESILFIYFTYLFFRRKFLQKWKKIRAHEFLVFCLLFVIIIAFMTGLTSGLYGVLVRLRAPLLPFFFILLTTNFDFEEEEIVSLSEKNG
jgi:hypothetical protein